MRLRFQHRVRKFLTSCATGSSSRLTLQRGLFRTQTVHTNQSSPWRTTFPAQYSKTPQDIRLYKGPCYFPMAFKLTSVILLLSRFRRNNTTEKLYTRIQNHQFIYSFYLVYAEPSPTASLSITSALLSTA
jgi:hypothetical protein